MQAGGVVDETFKFLPGSSALWCGVATIVRSGCGRRSSSGAGAQAEADGCNLCSGATGGRYAPPACSGFVE